MNPTICPDLTALQKVAGFVDLMSILQVGAIILAVVCICILFKNWLIPLLKMVPVEVYEVGGYIVAIGSIIYAYFASQTNQLWFSLGGCLLFAGMLSISSHIHKLKPNYTNYFTLLTVVFSGAALFYHQPVIGFFAIVALMSALGFCAAVVPCGYVIGFQDDKALYRATTAAFAILILTVVEKLYHLVLTPQAFSIFEAGGLWLGSFVGYLGLLIVSSRYYYDGKLYALRQIITIAFGVAALVVGSVFDINVLRGVGGTFFVLYLIEKPFELPAENVTEFAAIGLSVSAAVASGVYWAQNHMNLVKPYLLF